MAIFGISLAVSAVLRIWELLTCVDSRGFIRRGRTEDSFFLLLFCALLLAASVAAGCFVRRCPEKPPRPNVSLCCSSLLLGGWIGFESLTVASPANVPSWQPLLMNVFGILSAVLFIAYAMSPLMKKQLPGALFILPVLFMMMRLIWVYTALNTLALTVEHVFLLLACGATLVFMLQLAKVFSGLGGEYHFKRVMVSGMFAVFFDINYAVPNIIGELYGVRQLSGESVSSELLLLLSAAFILSFMISYFSLNNLKSHHRYHHHRHSCSADDVPRTDYYLGGTR